MKLRPCQKCNGTGKEIDQAALGLELRQMREKMKVSLRDAAQAMHISPPYLSDLELGHRHWNADLIAAYKKAIQK